MKINEVLFASHNDGKIKEIKEILEPCGIKVKTYKDINFPDIEETGTTFAENSLLKSQTLAKSLGIPCIADDSGLCVDILDGVPGVYSARYAPNRDFDKGIEKLLKEIEACDGENRSAHFSCVISLAYPNGNYELFEGRVDGHIADKPTGKSGFGYDPVFVPEGYRQSFAELGENEKNKISHRGRALQKFKIYIESL